MELGITVFHDEVESLTIKIQNGVHLEIKNIVSNLERTSWFGLKTDFNDE